MNKSKSELSELMNVGKAFLKDLQCLGIEKIEQLKTENPDRLYQKLQHITGKKQDPCVWDTFAAIIHEAKTSEKLPWWHWSKIRKSMKICFEKASRKHKDIIFNWLAEPHIQEFWDNTQAHKDDLINFMQGRKTPSTYANGKYVYWIAKFQDEPFAMLMTIQEIDQDDINTEKLERLSKTGHTYGIEFMIGNTNFFGKGYGAKTLMEFIAYFRKWVDPKADTFLIDPAINNPKAKHVYMKAGFTYVCDFMMKGNCSGTGKLHHLLIKKF